MSNSSQNLTPSVTDAVFHNHSRPEETGILSNKDQLKITEQLSTGREE